MTIVTTTEMINHLNHENINTEDFTDETMEFLINETIEKLTGLLNLPLEPIPHIQIVKIKHIQNIILDYYPIDEIEEITLNDEEITDYTIDKESGIIYFKKHLTGLLQIHYTNCLSETVLKFQIKPLLKDMLTYDLNTESSKDATSVKEGDVQINYDSSTLLGTQINNRIENLKFSLNGVRTRQLI